jgi:hypothetical protein
MTKAMPKKTSTPAAPSAMSPIALAKPMMWTETSVVLVLLADFLEFPGDFLQIEALAGLRVLLLQGGDDHRRGVVDGDDAAAPVGFGDVFAHEVELLGRAVEVRGNDVAPAEAVLDDLGVAHVRREHRSDRTALDTLDKNTSSVTLRSVSMNSLV